MPGTNNFEAIANNFKPALSQIVRKAALDIQAQAQQNAPVDTGFLKNSIYTVTSQDSTYGNAGTPPGDATMLPEVAAPEDETTAYVAVGASYGIYQEMGTRFQPAQPFLGPAVETVSQSFDAIMQKLESLLQ
jgi:HK97 gp10 family phage protein